MEVMWGIKHLMKSLMPAEDSELSKDDRLQMSYGMETILKRHGIVVTPEMVRSPPAFPCHVLCALLLPGIYCFAF